MNDDGLFSRCHSTRNGIGEIGEGFDLYRRRGIQIGEIYGRKLENFLEFRLKNMPEIWRRRDQGCGQAIDVTGAHGRMRNKSGSIKVKERDEGIFFFSLFNLIETLCRIIY